MARLGLFGVNLFYSLRFFKFEGGISYFEKLFLDYLIFKWILEGVPGLGANPLR